VLPIAERLVLGGATAAERDDGTAANVENVPFGILNQKVPGNAQRSVVSTKNFRIWHMKAPF
jgi:hypothetical protein